MPLEAGLGIAVFVGLFFAWVIVPSFLRKWHRAKVKEDAGA